MDYLTLAPTIPRGRPRSVSDPQKVFPLAKVPLKPRLSHDLTKLFHPVDTGHDRTRKHLHYLPASFSTGFGLQKNPAGSPSLQ